VFKVGGGLTIENVLFDAIDSMDNDGQDPADSSNECFTTGTGSTSTLGSSCPYVRNPTDYCPGGMYSGSFFEFDLTTASSSVDPPTLTITDCSFSSFLYEMNSFIALNPFGGHIEITGTTFTDFNFCGSLIRYKDQDAIFENEAYYDETDYLENYMRRQSNYQAYLFETFKYDGLTAYTGCSTATTDTTNLCFSLTIDDCIFQDFGSHKGAETFDFPMLVDPDLGLRFYGTVIDLSDFRGHVSITNSEFTDNTLSYTSCDVAADILADSYGDFEDLYPSWGGTKTEVQIRAVVSIQNHYHQVILAGNTFSGNSETKGVVYLDVHDRTSNHLIIHGNIFENNAGYLEASALNVRIRASSSTPHTNVDSSFGTADIYCANTLIEDNTFTDNYGCQYEVGAVLKV